MIKSDKAHDRPRPVVACDVCGLTIEGEGNVFWRIDSKTFDVLNGGVPRFAHKGDRSIKLGHQNQCDDISRFLSKLSANFERVQES